MILKAALYIRLQLPNLTKPTVHLSHTPQYTIRNRNVRIPFLNGTLWDQEQVHYGVCFRSVYRQTSEEMLAIAVDV